MKKPLLIAKSAFCLNGCRVRLVLIELVVFATALFAQSSDSPKVITPRDSVFALLDTTATCTSKFGTDTTKWNVCVNLKEGDGCTYFTFKKGKANGPAWESIGCNELIRENGAFSYYRNGEEQYQVSYASNGYIDEIWRNNKWIYYGGRTKPFTGTDSIFENDTLVRVSDYKNGLQDGLDYTYYPNKQKECERFFLRGLQEGQEICYREDGQVEMESYYKKGNLVGTSKEYYSNGSIGKKGAIHRVLPYVNGKVDGLVKEYYQNGQIWRAANYKKGKQEGKQTEYSAKTGKVISTAIFKNGELVGDKKCSDGRFGSNDLDCTPLNE